ncbi:hypothetical protein BU14_0464s0008 [Porphyra umbilicalis]|uniref:Uncharacterized protein n=1 Tax=Porphyra umbilicalis TaxID=2786 RepID=A0A1X6NU50_PORUM|nr:hypothetical protein BU14_0464s0008 [Porphyra umbilicalis]|eukprot:OSX72134.1 hypothetical protein BU14_0464s0008 [Porphyra umbilicalis]
MSRCRCGCCRTFETAPGVAADAGDGGATGQAVSYGAERAPPRPQKPPHWIHGRRRGRQQRGHCARRPPLWAWVESPAARCGGPPPPVARRQHASRGGRRATGAAHAAAVWAPADGSGRRVGDGHCPRRHRQPHSRRPCRDATAAVPPGGAGAAAEVPVAPVAVVWDAGGGAPVRADRRRGHPSGGWPTPRSGAFRVWWHRLGWPRRAVGRPTDGPPPTRVGEAKAVEGARGARGNGTVRRGEAAEPPQWRRAGRHGRSSVDHSRQTARLLRQAPTTTMPEADAAGAKTAHPAPRRGRRPNPNRRRPPRRRQCRRGTASAAAGEWGIAVDDVGPARAVRTAAAAASGRRRRCSVLPTAPRPAGERRARHWQRGDVSTARKTL